MSVKFMNGNIFDSTAEYLCHQVNCKGKMGSGIAKEVRARYPEVYRRYVEYIKNVGTVGVFGTAQIVDCHTRKIVNLFAQYDYGRDGARYTDYTRFCCCLYQMLTKIPAGSSIAFPYKIGCGLAGGDWDKVYKMIVEYLASDYKVEIWKKE